jgi:Protein of unknown function (DUF4236)
MGWNLRFWRRARTAPGVNLNWSRSGPSVSVGPRGAKVSVGRMGIRRTVGIPGTGLFATNQQSWSSLRDTKRPRPVSDPGPTVRPAPDSHAAVAPPGCDVERCGFCGGQVGTEMRCGMCGEPAERWRDA